MEVDDLVSPHTYSHGPAFYYFFAPQGGVVAMISQEDVEAFWIIHIDTTIGKVLASTGS